MQKNFSGLSGLGTIIRW